MKQRSKKLESSNGQSIGSAQAPPTRVNGNSIPDTGSANKNGLTALVTKVTGADIKLTVTGSFSTLMVTCMKVSGLMTRRKGRVRISMLTGVSTQDSGKKIVSMGTVERLGLREAVMRATIGRERNTDMESISGLTVACTLDSGKPTK